MAHSTHYTTRALLEARVPKSLVARACDRDEDGAEDTDGFDNLLEAVETEIDGLLAPSYTVPFTTAPAAVQSAALVMLASACYENVATPEKDNPFAGRAGGARDLLTRCGQGAAMLEAPDYASIDAPDESDWSMEKLDEL